MKVFDTDIFSDFIQSRAATVTRAAAIPRAMQAITIVTVEEVLRGRLNAIRQAEAAKGGQAIEDAYARLEQSLEQLSSVRVLPYDSTADILFHSWRAAKIRIGTQDLRIAAIAFGHKATVVTRNARDFAQVPGLSLEVWT